MITVAFPAPALFPFPEPFPAPSVAAAATLAVLLSQSPSLPPCNKPIKPRIPCPVSRPEARITYEGPKSKPEK